MVLNPFSPHTMMARCLSMSWHRLTPKALQSLVYQIGNNLGKNRATVTMGAAPSEPANGFGVFEELHSFSSGQAFCRRDS
jgi:hypothetical protein